MLHIHQLLDSFIEFWVWYVFNNRNSLFNFLFFEFPGYFSDNSTFINSSTNVLINESLFINNSRELIINQNLILLSTLDIFKGNRIDIEKILSAQEWFAQRSIAPLCLLTNKLRYNLRAMAVSLDGSSTSCMEIVKPSINQSDVCFLHDLTITEVLFKIHQCWRLLPIG